MYRHNNLAAEGGNFLLNKKRDILQPYRATLAPRLSSTYIIAYVDSFLSSSNLTRSHITYNTCSRQQAPHPSAASTFLFLTFLIAYVYCVHGACTVRWCSTPRHWVMDVTFHPRSGSSLSLSQVHSAICASFLTFSWDPSTNLSQDTHSCIFLES